MGMFWGGTDGGLDPDARRSKTPRITPPIAITARGCYGPRHAVRIGREPSGAGWLKGGQGRDQPYFLNPRWSGSQGCSGMAELGLDKFSIAPDILRTSEPLVSLGLCDARLQSDGRWPWIVLIPRQTGAREIDHLPPTQRAALMEEVVAAGAAVRAIGSALGRPVEKLNIGLLGNITPQLHAHVVGRRADDPAWPGPVWGVGAASPYGAEALEQARQAALSALSLFPGARPATRQRTRKA